MKNTYIIKENKAKLIIYSNKYGIIEVIIDADDINKMKDIKWHYQKNKESAYICGRINGKLVRLHRYLLDVTDSSVIIDHIDRNTLNNCKSNLRLATYQENSFNKSIRCDNKSGYSGVRFLKTTGKWVARIKLNKRLVHLGYFYDKKEAILNRQIAEEKLFKEFSTVNKYITDDIKLIEKAWTNLEKRLQGII